MRGMSSGRLVSHRLAVHTEPRRIRMDSHRRAYRSLWSSGQVVAHLGSRDSVRDGLCHHENRLPSPTASPVRRS